MCVCPVPFHRFSFVPHPPRLITTWQPLLSTRGVPDAARPFNYVPPQPSPSPPSPPTLTLLFVVRPRAIAPHPRLPLPQLIFSLTPHPHLTCPLPSPGRQTLYSKQVKTTTVSESDDELMVDGRQGGREGSEIEEERGERRKRGGRGKQWPHPCTQAGRLAGRRLLTQALEHLPSGTRPLPGGEA